jgi:2-polyprenyl-6-methoxyphenol hydroxylase-like FAD-dependent oxidoreductase
MKVLIVGGGIAGTALAAFLQKNKKFKITLIDQAPKFGNIGFAVAIWGNGRQILTQLGLGRSLVAKFGYEIPWTAIENPQGKLLRALSFDIFKDFGRTVVLPRADLHGALVNLLKGPEVRFNTSIKQIHNTPVGARVVFTNNKIEEFDLVVGADGIHSIVRDLVFGKNFLKYNGWRAWQFWIPEQRAHPSGAIDLLGNGKGYIVYPLFDRAVGMFGAMMPPKSQTSNVSPIDDLHKAFEEFSPSVHSAIDAITDPKIFNDDINHVEMKQWYKDRVVLVGDAQHASSPIAGMGSSMALEDAYVLATELKKARKETIGEALERFSRRRTPRLKKFKKVSRHMDNIFLARGFYGHVRDLLTPFLPKSYFANAIKSLLKQKI